MNALIIQPHEWLFEVCRCSDVMLSCVYNPMQLNVCREISDIGPAHANARMSTMADGNLQISNVSEEDSRLYTCSVKNSNRSISAELEVLSKCPIPSENHHHMKHQN